jgi:hypothetical protein
MVVENTVEFTSPQDDVQAIEQLKSFYMYPHSLQP